MEAIQLLPTLTKYFETYKTLAEKAFQQLDEEHFFFRPVGQSNSIAIIIQHMYGNAMSRFTNILTGDGEKEWRKRDAEFEAMDVSKQDLMDFWKTGWQTVFNALGALTEDDLGKTVYIRSEPHTVLEALHRQLTHYSYHVGQIVLLAKMQKEDFTSLSIPKAKAPGNG
ncbi:DUF1572 family protein [Aridibaculum aurantiacum]|uniref:DUF1572 family protein n=1 Tax=Aridibaculum aurantiacum TaxID=2810307 RepID=UPI001A960054|nr:DUF1572 family protein [Aridibaculum aurantiacum]